MTLLRVEALSKRYGDVVALDSVSFDVPRGRRMAVVGRSGSGKSTLLRILAGFEAPDEGRVSIGDEILVGVGRDVPAHRRNFVIVAQEGALFPHLTVRDNIGFGLPRGVPGREARIRELAGMVELPAGALGRAPHELSGGQQQRVALARALAREPRLVLLDEPFSALDAGLRDTARAMVARTLDAAGVGCVLVTHDQAEALSFADVLLVLRDGRVAQIGEPEDLYRRPTDRDVAALLGEAVVVPAVAEAGWATFAFGRLPLSGDERSGPLEILLRPDQLRLEPASAGEAEGRPGRVTAVAFGGATSTVTVAFDGDTGPAPLVVAVPSLDRPSTGTEVRVSVRGEAHVMSITRPFRGHRSAAARDQSM